MKSSPRPCVLPAAERGVRQRRVVERRDIGDPARLSRGQRLAGPRAAALRRPPASAEGRRRDDAGDDLVLDHQADERRPDRNAADEVLGAVDRVDDPAARAPAASCPLSSPSTASRGRARPRVRRMDSSTALSASVTGVRSGLVTTCRSSALNRSIVSESASSARTCAEPQVVGVSRRACGSGYGARRPLRTLRARGHLSRSVPVDTNERRMCAHLVRETVGRPAHEARMC